MSYYYAAGRSGRDESKRGKDGLRGFVFEWGRRVTSGSVENNRLAYTVI